MHLTDRWTDGQTDRQRILIVKPHLHSMQCSNEFKSTHKTLRFCTQCKQYSILLLHSFLHWQWTARISVNWYTYKCYCIYISVYQISLICILLNRLSVTNSTGSG